jgi:acyl-ACP thioesterase
VKVPQEFADTYGLEPQLEMECAKRKLHIPDDMEKKGEIEVPQFFIDSNHHMNNEKYVMLAQQLLPNDFEISELRVEYRKEAKLGDTVISYVKYTSKSVTVVLADTDKKPYSVVEFLSKPVPGK